MFHRLLTRRMAVVLAMLTLLISLAPRSAAAAGKAKDLEGTPQAKAYRALLKTVADGDFEGYKKGMTAEAAQGIDKQTKEMKMDGHKVMDMLKAMSPTDVKIVSIKEDGDKAVLNATGMSMGEMNKGTVNMVREKDQWKVADQSWTNAK